LRSSHALHTYRTVHMELGIIEGDVNPATHALGRWRLRPEPRVPPGSRGDCAPWPRAADLTPSASRRWPNRSATSFCRSTWRFAIGHGTTPPSPRACDGSRTDACNTCGSCSGHSAPTKRRSKVAPCSRSRSRSATTSSPPTAAHAAGATRSSSPSDGYRSPTSRPVQALMPKDVMPKRYRIGREGQRPSLISSISWRCAIA